MVSMPEPATKIQSGYFCQNEAFGVFRQWKPLTQAKCSAEKLATKAAEHDAPSIVDPVDFTMVQLEHTDHVVRPCSDNGNGDETNQTGSHA